MKQMRKYPVILFFLLKIQICLKKYENVCRHIAIERRIGADNVLIPESLFI